MRNNLKASICCSPQIKCCKPMSQKSRSQVSSALSNRTHLIRPNGPSIRETCCQPEPICCPPNPPQEQCVPQEQSAPQEQCCPAPCLPVTCCMKRRYIQPKVRQSFRPIRQYHIPILPMPCSTIYNNSFECVDPKTAAMCRMPQAKPKNSLRIPLANFTKDTVTRLSFPPPCPSGRTFAIRPNARSMLTKGLEHPMQSLTTQKHDFVPKWQGRRPKMVPVDKIIKRCGAIQQETTQKLSFMIPDNCHYTKSVSCKPQRFYKAPVLPFAKETTQKLSYMPVRTLAREIHPWAQKKKYMRPVLKFAKDTVNKTSYMLPGTFVDEVCDCGCTTGCAKECQPSIPVDCFPRAGF